MAEESLSVLRQELNFKKLQLNAIYEFSSALYYSFTLEHVFRIFFSTLMGPLGISRAFFFERESALFNRKGVFFSTAETELIKKKVHRAVGTKNFVRTEDLAGNFSVLREALLAKKIQHLINIAESHRKPAILGLGNKFQTNELSADDLEFISFLSRFALIALENIRYLEQIVEKKRMDYELTIAREIQMSLLPQSIPPLKNYDVAVVYEPIQEVGGDYYDILDKRKHLQPLVVADVEGKGLAAALLAASTQAIFHSLNELYLFKPGKFVAKANSLIAHLTKGQRFVTLCWLLLDDEDPAITYVNAGHPPPLLFSRGQATPLNRGGVPCGFFASADYGEETVPLTRGDVLVVFTDGVLEVENSSGQEFGEGPLTDFVRQHTELSAREIAGRLFQLIKRFSQGKKFRDDFTILVIKVL